MKNTIQKMDSLDFLKSQKSNDVDILFQDPPYALGSEIVIKENGKPEYSKASDFMNKWDMPTGEWWESWFAEAYRTLKYGGHCIMFGIDRQLLLFKYYAHAAGFTEKQSMYWYFICLSDDSEILTDNGWRKIDTIKETDKVAEFSLQTQAVDFRVPKDIYRYDFNGQLVYISNKNTEQLLTPNHRCVILEDNELKYRYAHELIGKETQFATLDRQEVWKLQVLERLQRVWRKVCSWNSATKEAVLYLGLFQAVFVRKEKGSADEKQGWKGRCNLLGMWKRVLEMAKRYKGNELLQSGVQVRESDTSGKKQWTEKQRQEEITRRNREDKTIGYSWIKTSLLEGWGNLQTTKRQLLWRKICALSERLFSYGSERRLCYATPAGSSTSVQDFKESGSGASYQPQSVGQSVRELNGIQEQPRPQEIRSGTRYKTSLATPTLKDYKGRVWCVETSTGAFIARRKGKVFITGNSNFPKATDLSKMIDKNAGTKGEVIGESKGQGYTSQQKKNKEHGFREYKAGLPSQHADKNIYAPGHELAKKYNGYKYSIAPLKQTNETILIFQKPYKTGSCLHDTLAYENGDEECCCGAVDVDGNRVGTEDIKTMGGDKFPNNYGTFKTAEESIHSGRHPSQTFCNTEASKVLDEQSGVSGGGKYKKQVRQRNSMKENGYGFNPDGGVNAPDTYGDTGGCSKILHKCDFEKGEFDLYHYNPKVSKKERNAGLEGFETGKGLKKEYRIERLNTHLNQKNTHPTLKPISLNEKILRLFKTPNDQKILFPFAGAGSEVIGGIKAGFDNWEACELSEEYIKIAEARIKHWSELPEQGSLLDK